jgi:hypothetical protein
MVGRITQTSDLYDLDFPYHFTPSSLVLQLYSYYYYQAGLAGFNIPLHSRISLATNAVTIFPDVPETGIIIYSVSKKSITHPIHGVPGLGLLLSDE